MELAFALAKRKQDLLDDIFRLYPRLEPAVQDVVEAQLMPLIQSLGATEKLLEILRKFPNGADKLVMRVVGVLSAEGSKTLVTLMKTLLSERDLDPRFVIPIVGDLDKVSCPRYRPFTSSADDFVDRNRKTTPSHCIPPRRRRFQRYGQDCFCLDASKNDSI